MIRKKYYIPEEEIRQDYHSCKDKNVIDYIYPSEFMIADEERKKRWKGRGSL